MADHRPSIRLGALALLMFSSAGCGDSQASERNAAAEAQAREAARLAEEREREWASAQRINTAAAYVKFRELYPQSEEANAAGTKLDELAMQSYLERAKAAADAPPKKGPGFTVQGSTTVNTKDGKTETTNLTGPASGDGKTA